MTDLETVARAMWEASGGHEYWDQVLSDDYYDGPGKHRLNRMAEAAFTALQKSGWVKVPEGWKCVPVEYVYPELLARIPLLKFSESD